jgi:hypothetical protein
MSIIRDTGKTLEEHLIGRHILKNASHQETTFQEWKELILNQHVTTGRGQFVSV